MVLMKVQKFVGVDEGVAEVGEGGMFAGHGYGGGFGAAVPGSLVSWCLTLLSFELEIEGAFWRAAGVGDEEFIFGEGFRGDDEAGELTVPEVASLVATTYKEWGLGALEFAGDRKVDSR